MKFRGQTVVLVPAGVHQLHVTRAAFDQAPRHQTISRETFPARSRTGRTFQNFFRLFGKVGQLRHARLHAIRHFILRNARGNFRVAEVVQLLFVDLGNRVEHAAFDLFASCPPDWKDKEPVRRCREISRLDVRDGRNPLPQ